jgi:hypothetical protein
LIPRNPEVPILTRWAHNNSFKHNRLIKQSPGGDFVEDELMSDFDFTTNPDQPLTWEQYQQIALEYVEPRHLPMVRRLWDRYESEGWVDQEDGDPYGWSRAESELITLNNALETTKEERDVEPA